MKVVATILLTLGMGMSSQLAFAQSLTIQPGTSVKVTPNVETTVTCEGAANVTKCICAHNSSYYKIYFVNPGGGFLQLSNSVMLEEECRRELSQRPECQ